MTTADHRTEIVSILVASGRVTSRELAQGFGVCVSTIRNYIAAYSGIGINKLRELTFYLTWIVFFFGLVFL